MTQHTHTSQATFTLLMLHRSRIGTSALWCLLLCALCGCRSARRTHFRHLQDQGTLALSSSNAYLGTNLLLAKEAEESRFLYNFLADRGAPHALAMSDEGYTLVLYYPRLKEMYRANYEDPEWIIRGPYPIARDHYVTLKRILRTNDDEPLLELWGRKKRFREPGPENVYAHITPLLRPKRKQQPRRSRSGSSEAEYHAPKKIKNPGNFDQEALLSTKYRERVKKQKPDLFHKVKPGHTWEQITSWYTKNKALVDVIRSTNKSTIGETLEAGEVVRIPGDYVKERKLME